MATFAKRCSGKQVLIQRQQAAVIDARHASRLVGQQRLDNAPLEVGQIVSAHADAESGFHPMGKTASL
jgi:hypothetical protein